MSTEPNGSVILRGRSLLDVCGYDRGRQREGLQFRHAAKQYDVALAGFPERNGTDLLMATVLLMGDGRDGAAACRQLACPYLLVPIPDDLDVVVVNNNETRRIGSVAELGPDHLRHWLAPQPALRVKVGLSQLPLFDIPVNLLAQTKQRHVDRIGPIIGDALAETAAVIRAKGGPRSDKRAPLIVVRALAALAIAHRKGVVGKAAAVVAAAEKEFPSTFGWQPTGQPVDRQLLNELVESLGVGIDFATLSPSILTDVYETALVDAATRRAMAIHYTPPGLAAQILQALPIETIHPEKRTVLDPTCGSGNILLAAYDRLGALQPKVWTNPVRHDDLIARISGRDVDIFAVELAKLALLLQGELTRNGWDVQPGDSASGSPDARATIVVCNPPWGAETLGWGKQRADRFVEFCLNAMLPGGLLGLVLPKSWLTTRASRDSRRRLEDSCDVLEVWRLPGGRLFASAGFPACVVVARHRGSADSVKRRPYRIQREVQGFETASFLRGLPARSTVILSSTDPIGAALPPVPSAAKTKPLGDIAMIRSGTQAVPPPDRQGGHTPFLSRWNQVETLATVTESHPAVVYLSYPADFTGKRGAELIPLNKILFSAATRARRPRSAIAVAGIAFTHSLRGIAPNDQADTELLIGLAVLLSSAYVTASVDRFGRDLNISATFLPNLPVPANKKSIRSLSMLRDANDLERDEAVWDVLAVPHDYREMVKAYLDPPVPPTAPLRSPMEDVARLGVIAKVDGQRVCVVIDGITDSGGVWVQVPPRLPAALLDTGATFEVHHVDQTEDLRRGSYMLQPLSWWETGSPVPPTPVPGRVR